MPPRALAERAWNPEMDALSQGFRRSRQSPRPSRPSLVGCGRTDKLAPRLDYLVERSSDKRRRIDSYRLDAKIGEGGMGEIFRAWDESLDRSVALKLINTQRLDNAQARQRFRREAKIAAGLSHPAIVQIHRLLETRTDDAEELDCLVMELVEGKTLRQRMARGRVPLAELLPIWRQITEGLAYAHAKGVVHRDLKVDNVMVTPLGHAKILDFGLAKSTTGAMSSLTRDGGVMGTLYAMAPEQARGQKVDARSDLFSLGVLFYETLFGDRPFVGEDAHELWLNVMLNPHLPASGRDPQVPAELAALIDRLLEKDPAARPQNAAEVLAVLDLFLPTASLASMTGASTPAPLPAPGLSTRHAVLAVASPPGDATMVAQVPVAQALAAPAASVSQAPAKPESLRSRLRLFVIGAFALLMAGLPPGVGGGPRSLALVADLESLPADGRALVGLLAERLMAGDDLPPLLPPSWTLDTPQPSAESLGGAATGLVRVEPGPAGPLLVLVNDGESTSVALGGDLSARLDLATNAVRRFFGRPPEPEALRLQLHSLLPADPAAALRYGEARAWLFVRRADRARVLLREDAPPLFSPWILARAEAAWQWGDSGEAGQLIQEVDFKVYPRPLFRRYYATAFEIAGNPDAGVMYRGLSPDSSNDIGLISRSVFLADREDLAFGLRQSRARQLARGDRVLAWVAFREMSSLGSREQYQRVMDEGRRALALAEASGGGRGLEAGLHFAMAQAASRLDQHGSALERYQQAHRLYDLPRDRALCLEGMAIARIHLQQKPSALTDFEELKGLYGSLGDDISASRAKANLATALSEAGYWADAEELFRQAIAEQQLGGKDSAFDVSQTLINFGVAYLESGRPRAAAEQYREAIVLLRRLERPDKLIIALSNQGEVDALRGALASARNPLDEATSLARRLGHPSTLEKGLIQHAEVELWYGETARAESLLAEARGLAQDELAPRLDFATGLLELEKENVSRASELVAPLADGQREADEETLFQAKILMARIHLSRAKAGPADHQTALDLLRSAQVTALESNNERHQAQALILEHVAEAKLGKGEARQQLARLAKDLEARGFGLFAREAASWLRDLG